jgi:hypothetical protein
MLAEDVLMEDIDIDQWRNAQDLLLSSSKEKRRIIVLHDNGVVRKCVHTSGLPVNGSVASITEPREFAKKLYEKNSNSIDFVSVFERHAFDEYFTRLQNSWRADESIDSFVYRTYELLDEYPEGLVTYPGEAKDNLGLQYNFGLSRASAETLVQSLVTPGMSLLVGVHQENSLWASLVMKFDDELDISELTTVNSEQMDINGDIDTELERASNWMKEFHPSKGVVILFSQEGFEQFRGAKNPVKAFSKLLTSRSVVISKI